MTTAAKDALEAWWAWVRDPDLLKPRTSGKDCLTKAEEELLRYGDIIEAALQAASQSKAEGGDAFDFAALQKAVDDYSATPPSFHKASGHDRKLYYDRDNFAQFYKAAEYLLKYAAPKADAGEGG
jgi:hypothetical protein